jgi:hypothetical protein
MSAKKHEELKQKVDQFLWVSNLPGERGKKWADHSLGHARDLLDRYNDAIKVQQQKATEMKEIGKLLFAHCKRMEKEVQLFFDDSSRARAEQAARQEAAQIPLIDENG